MDKLITKILRHTKKYIFYQSDQKKIHIILIHSHQTSVAVLAVVIFFLFDNSQGKEVSAPAK